jgi:hypothetical protein
MKYLKFFEDYSGSDGIPPKFSIGDWVIPIIESKRFNSSIAYKIAGTYSPYYNLTIGLGNFYSYSLETENEYEILQCKESDLRKATEEEIEFTNTTKRYNI